MSTQGLQELRKAEEEARKQVEAARQDGVARLKQAKAEAVYVVCVESDSAPWERNSN